MLKASQTVSFLLSCIDLQYGDMTKKLLQNIPIAMSWNIVLTSEHTYCHDCVGKCFHWIAFLKRIIIFILLCFLTILTNHWYHCHRRYLSSKKNCHCVEDTLELLNRKLLPNSKLPKQVCTTRWTWHCSRDISSSAFHPCIEDDWAQIQTDHHSERLLGAQHLIRY